MSIVSLILGVVFCFSCNVNICLIRCILEFIVGVHKHLYLNPLNSNELLELQLRYVGDEEITDEQLCAQLIYLGEEINPILE